MMDAMKQRKKIEIECQICKEKRTVRADSKAKLCRKCLLKSNCENAKYKNIQNLRFGKLTAVKVIFKKNKNYYWECLCDCGKKTMVMGSRLRSGNTKSCGCIVKIRNGLSKSKEYRIWKAMLQRCYDITAISYKNYGAKGIIVCDKWKNSFEAFVEDMGLIPKGLTLDRIDPFGNYEKNNCRLVTYKIQNNNKQTKNHKITAFGKTQTLSEWADEYNLNWSTLRKRIINLNWTIEKALTKPPHHYEKKDKSSKNYIT